jgi:hypothetical protein
MEKNIFKRSRDVLIETTEELVFGFDYAHPERAKALKSNQDVVQEKTVVERAIAERKQQVRAMRSKEELSKDKERNR